jgi:hypothetical protein
MLPNAKIARFRSRALKRGVTAVVPRMLDLAKLTMTTGFLLGLFKASDYSMSMRGMVSWAAGDSITASASACGGLPTGSQYDGINAVATVEPSANTDMLSAEALMLPPVELAGVSRLQAFPSAHMPIRGMRASATSVRPQAEDHFNGGVLETIAALYTSTAARELTCQAIPQSTPTPATRIKTMSHSIWGRSFGVAGW